MNARRAFAYMLAQFVGAVVAACINLLLYDTTIKAFEKANGIERGQPSSVRSAMAFGEYFPNPDLTHGLGPNGPFNVDDVTHFHALCVEAWGTMVLSFVIFAVTHPRNAITTSTSPPTVVPLLIGATVSVLLSLYAPITQAGWNPARDFGPRLVAAAGGWGQIALPGPRGGFWVYIVGPFIGAPLGAAAAEFGLHGSWNCKSCGHTGNQSALSVSDVELEIVASTSDESPDYVTRQQDASAADFPNKILRWCWVPDPRGQYRRVLAAPEDAESNVGSISSADHNHNNVREEEHVNNSALESKT